MKRLVIMLMATLVGLLPGYALAQGAGKESPAAAAQPQKLEQQGKQPQEGKSYTSAEKRAYEKQSAAKLDEMQQKIHDLGVDVQKAEPQIKRAMLRAMLPLQRQYFAAKDKLAALQKASDKDWGRLQAELEKMKEALNKNYEAISSRLK